MAYFWWEHQTLLKGILFIVYVIKIIIHLDWKRNGIFLIPQLMLSVYQSWLHMHMIKDVTVLGTLSKIIRLDYLGKIGLFLNYEFDIFLETYFEENQQMGNLRAFYKIYCLI